MILAAAAATATTAPHISYLHAIVYGAIQGLTEFLPISSSGHLLIWGDVTGWGDPGASFSAVVQLGTMLAVTLFFWRDLTRIVWAALRSIWTPALRRDHDAKMGWYVAFGTIPIAVAGLAFSSQIETAARNLYLTATMLIVFGIILWLADVLRPQRLGTKRITFWPAMAFGVAQMLALIPGVSRSGATITAGRLMTFNREAAARFSFLLSIPAVVLSGLYQLKDIGTHGAPSWGPTIVATIVAFVVGFASIAWLLRYLIRHTTLVFMIYRVIVGSIVLILLWTGTVSSS